MIELAELNALLKRCTGSTYPFYRKHYKTADIVQVHSLEEWRALPFLTKDNLLDTPLQERIFCPLSEIDILRTTSGTSGKPTLFVPRTEREMSYRLRFHDFKHATFAHVTPGTPHGHEKFQKAHGGSPTVVTFDPKHIRASVHLAAAARVTCLSMFSFHLPLIGEEMLKQNAADALRFIEVVGEPYSEKLFNYVRTIFPNAALTSPYSTTEIDDSPTGMPCRTINEKELRGVYHARAHHFHEIIDPESGACILPIAGVEGELVVSADGVSLPLVRYRTGDMVRVVEEHCAEHGTWSFTVLGRVASDFVRVPGGMLRADELERVLRQFSAHISDEYELQVREENVESTLRIRCTLLVDPIVQTDLESLGQQISGLLRIGPTFTYQNGVEQGLFAPLVCRALGTAPTNRKRKRLMRV